MKETGPRPIDTTQKFEINRLLPNSSVDKFLTNQEKPVIDAPPTIDISPKKLKDITDPLPARTGVTTLVRFLLGKKSS